MHSVDRALFDDVSLSAAQMPQLESCTQHSFIIIITIIIVVIIIIIIIIVIIIIISSSSTSPWRPSALNISYFFT